MALEEFRVRFGKAMMELVGTAMLVMTIQLSVANTIPAAAFVIGLVLVALVFAGGPVSGAHYNPAISLAVFLRGKINLHEMLVYWIFQIGGGLLGALLGGVIVGKFADISIGPGYNFLQAFLAELVFTALLCFVVLGVATNSKAEGNSYYGCKSSPIVDRCKLAILNARETGKFLTCAFPYSPLFPSSCSCHWYRSLGWCCYRRARQWWRLQPGRSTWSCRREAFLEAGLRCLGDHCRSSRWRDRSYDILLVCAG